MCSMRNTKPNSERQSIEFAHTPYRRKPFKQLCNEFNNVMQQLPYNAPQIERDAVQSVTTTSERPYSVYDIQVERDCNFFANDILVHNCLIIDDPIKTHKTHNLKQCVNVFGKSGKYIVNTFT